MLWTHVCPAPGDDPAIPRFRGEVPPSQYLALYVPAVELLVHAIRRIWSVRRSSIPRRPSRPASLAAELSSFPAVSQNANRLAARMKLRWKTCGQEVSSGSAFICAGPGVEMPHPCYWSEEIVLRGERSALSVPGTRRYSASMSNLNGRLYKRRPEWLLRRAPQTQSVVEHPHSEKACRSPHQTRTEHPYTAD